MLSSSGRTFLVKMALRATLALATTPKKTPSRDSDPGTNAAMSRNSLFFQSKIGCHIIIKNKDIDRECVYACVCVGGRGERERDSVSHREREKERAQETL